MKTVRQIDGLCALGVLALVLISGAAAYKLAMHQQGRVDHHNETTTQLHEDLQAARGHIRQLQQARGIAQRYLDAFQARGVSEAEVGSFLDRLEKVAADEGVTLTDLRQQPPIQLQKDIAIPLILACRGGFEDVHRFLYALENAGPILKMDTLNLTADRAAAECALSLRVNLIQR